MVEKDENVANIKKEIYFTMVNDFEIKGSKKIFDKFTKMYEERILRLK